MSNYDSNNRRRKIAGPFYGTGPSRPTRSAFGYWLPLVLTVTVATAGLVAWVWSERGDGDEDEDLDYRDESTRPPTEGGYSGSQFPVPPSEYGPPGTEGPRGATGALSSDVVDDSLVGRMSGAIRRSPSPQQVFDSAGRMAAAGMAAAGAAIGLGAIREESENRNRTEKNRRTARSEREEGFSDHERWSEEAGTRRNDASSRSKRDVTSKGQARKIVAVVVSANTAADASHDEDAAYRTEHASILSHLPQHHNPNTTSLFVLIYAPHLTSLPSTTSTSERPNQTTSSNNPYFEALSTQAQALVDAPENILPFSTPTGYIHMLRHLAPQTVYIADSETLSGEDGKNIADLKGWVGQVIVVVGDEGHGGLVDTETEGETDAEGRDQKNRGGERRSGWWESSQMVGLGKGVEVVDVGRVGDDWARRIGGRE